MRSPFFNQKEYVPFLYDTVREYKVLCRVIRPLGEGPDYHFYCQPHMQMIGQL